MNTTQQSGKSVLIEAGEGTKATQALSFVDFPHALAISRSVTPTNKPYNPLSPVSHLSNQQTSIDVSTTPSMASKTFSELQEEEYTSTTIGTIKCTAPIPFGGEEQWLFFPDDGKFDLSRGSERRMTVECDKERHNHTGFTFDPDSAVLIVVDMQNYFVHPQYRDHAAGIKAVEPTLRVIERCRREGIQIAWLNWGLTERDLKTMAPAIQRGFRKTLGWHVGLGAQLPGNQGRCLFKRTWNAELYEPFKAVAQPGDMFFDKTRMSGLWSTAEPLHEYLRTVDKKTLIFTGVNTDQCVFGTVSDAYSYGWDCVLLDDCTGTMTGLGAQAVAEYNIAQNMGFVTGSKEFCEATNV